MNVLSKSKLILVFDTETTGLFPKNKTNITDCPYITQLSYIIYNIDTNQIVSIYNNYLNIPQHIIIPEIVTKITGITREICTEKGKEIIDVLIDFHNAYIQCDYVIAHNWSFDSKMLMTEIERNEHTIRERIPHMYKIFTPEVDRIIGVRHYCTMRTGRNIYRLNKYPKLVELYHKLFKTTPENLHNSVIDTLVCLRCFLVIEHNYTFPDNEFNNLLQMYSL